MRLSQAVFCGKCSSFRSEVSGGHRRQQLLVGLLHGLQHCSSKESLEKKRLYEENTWGESAISQCPGLLPLGSVPREWRWSDQHKITSRTAAATVHCCGLESTWFVPFTSQNLQHILEYKVGVFCLQKITRLTSLILFSLVFEEWEPCTQKHSTYFTGLRNNYLFSHTASFREEVPWLSLALAMISELWEPEMSCAGWEVLTHSPTNTRPEK